MDTKNQHAIDTVALISDKWTMPVLHVVVKGTSRYGDIRREVEGITKKMLTQTLRKLERSGLIERTDYDEAPPRVEYTPTALTHSLVPQLTALCKWWNRNAEAIEAARSVYDANRDGWI